MLTRVLTAVVALAVFLAGLFLLPLPWWAGFVGVLAAIAAWEWAGLAGAVPKLRAVYAAAAAGGCALLYLGHDAVDGWPGMVSVAFWASIGVWSLWRRWRPGSVTGRLAIGLALVLPTWWAFVELQSQPYRLLALAAVVWVADTAAFLVGRTWGKHRCAPEISPGKTWEGVAGAFAGVGLYAWLLAPALGRLTVVAAVFGVMTVLSIAGDLFESLAKRQAGVKDSGRWLPGHGGLLDRIDSLTAALPFAALVFRNP
jgi:phosphatidate cytidylyltransferase